MGRRGLVCFDYPADYDSQVLKASEYPRSDLFHCPKMNKSMMSAARTSAQFEISMPAIDVFWLNHSMWLYPTIRADTGSPAALALLHHPVQFAFMCAS
jgi:hypothetical protein